MERTAHTAIAILILVGNLIALGVDVSSHDKPMAWEHYETAARWCRDNLPDDAVISTRKPSTFHVLSDRKTVGYAWGPPDTVLAGFLRDGVTHVIVDWIGYASTPMYLVPALNAFPDRFRIIASAKVPVVSPKTGRVAGSYVTAVVAFDRKEGQ